VKLRIRIGGRTICERFPQETLSKMKELVLKGVEEGVEYGAYILRDLTLSEPIRGGPGYVLLEVEKKPPNAIGYFHTHGRYVERKIGFGKIIEARPVPSPEDILTHILEDLHVDCIGILKNGDAVIRCWELNTSNPSVRRDVEYVKEEYDEFVRKLTELVKKYELKTLPADVISEAGFDELTRRLEGIATEEELDELTDNWIGLYSAAEDFVNAFEEGDKRVFLICERIL